MSFPCLCSQCNLSSTACVCGTFECPEVPDEGKGYPYRQKITCEAPTLPTAPCDEDDYVTVPTGNPARPFEVLSKLFDENCEVVTDEDGDPIVLVIT